MISGAISLAVKEINSNGKLKDMGHSLKFIVAETFGEEVSSIRQTARLWTDKVYAYIGPQETCVHEGRMAAAFNLPMISYVSVIRFCHSSLLSLSVFICCLVFLCKQFLSNDNQNDINLNFPFMHSSYTSFYHLFFFGLFS